MANHGFTTVGTTIKQATYRAVYTHVNAGIQANTIMVRNAQSSSSGGTAGEFEVFGCRTSSGLLEDE